MSAGPDPAETIGQVTHCFSHRSVAALRLSVPLALGDKIHIRGHTTDLVQTVGSMEVQHAKVDRVGPGDDVALEVDEHVRKGDLILNET